MREVLVKLWGYRHGLKSRSVDMAVVGLGISFVRILAFATALLVARSAGAATFGEYSLFTTVFVLVSEMPSALDTVFIRHANSPDASLSETEHLIILLLAKVLFAIFLCFIAVIASDFIAQYFLGKAQAASILFYGIVSGAVYSISTTLISLYQKRRQFVKMSLLRILPNLSLLVSIAITVVVGGTITENSIETIYLAVSAFLAFGAAIFLAKKLQNSFRVALAQIPAFYRIGGSLVASNALINLTSRLDVFFLIPFITFHELGIYGAAVRYTAIAGIVTGIITTIMLPKAPPALSNRSHFNKYLIEAAVFGVLQSIFVGALILFVDPLVQIMFGDEYMGMKWFAILLLTQSLLVAYGVPFQALLQCGKYVSIFLYLSITRLLVAVVLLKMLVPAYGAIGGAVAMVVSTGLFTVAMAFLALKNKPPKIHKILDSRGH